MKERDQFSLVCKALGNPLRLKIVRHLMRVDRCICGEVVDILPIAQATVSQHLNVLKEAGLIKGEIVGPSTCYCINRETIERFKRDTGKL